MGTTMNEEHEELVPCEACDGRGWNHEPTLDEEGEQYEMAQEECSVCGGTGWVLR